MRINSKNKKKTSAGFTPIELMLAVAFLGTLLLSVAMLAMRLVDMYTKGATMRAINSTGSAIVDDVRSNLTSSSLWTDKIGDDLNADRKQYYRAHYYTTQDGEQYADYGAFCTNTYTYVFNYQPAMLRYRNREEYNYNYTKGYNERAYLSISTDSSSGRPYGLARIKDPGCAKFNRLGLTLGEVNALKSELKDEDKFEYADHEFYQGQKHYFEVDEKSLTVLLDGSKSDEGTDLQLYDFSIMSATQSRATNQALFDVAFVLGTTRGGIDVKSSNNYCKQQTKALSGKDYAETFDNNAISYCSVNRFDFVVRQTGEKE